ncbi:hypothetical protein Q9295_17660 [Xinfangfangia sp. CPCC 101601]|uniref:NERD domain-containing protein n=1 Tax=Pseudogemmobacter lacusdianii TaxID=3069608 RepID=A0ABU0W2F6_9RHOB|nr:hypothetical protein [Xinfangfangia sp. CPCC 101601]MDQ2068197.1 hypothetical protein [Xinfangfangia sp. CPCC 101601]
MTDPQFPRISEAQADRAITDLLQASPVAQKRFLAVLGPEFADASVVEISRQRRHAVDTGSIDLVMRLSSGWQLLVENKIDAGWSVTRDGQTQPLRYARTISALEAQGHKVRSVLIAPLSYLQASRNASEFQHNVAYEQVIGDERSVEAELLRAAIVQAATPYEAVPNALSGDFFTGYANLIAREYPALVLKRNPNGGETRPSGSRTFYFEAKRMLRNHPGLPLPRISVQAWDSNASMASAKLMIADWALHALQAPPPASLRAIGGYLRPAGRSLGLTIDTPRLETQSAFVGQEDAVRAGLNAVARLVDWWNVSGADILDWFRQTQEFRA